MFFMPETPGEAEQFASHGKKQGGEFSREFYLWLVRLLTAAYIVGMLWSMMRDDEVRMYTLHWSIKVFQSIARNAGICALLCEQRYNDTVGSLH
jgi:hypothetical protein